MNKTARRITKALIAGSAAAVSVIGLTGSASASNVSQLNRGSTLNGGDSIIKYVANGLPGYELRMQTDGNLVEYRWNNGSVDKVCWATGTNGYYGAHATYQNDGNFVLYSSGGSALWSTGTQGKSGNSVSINDRGVMYVGNQQIVGAGIC
ncbi:hypothetical protein HUT16_30135 [Kitasatospora sp. NA04385]|uniref:hypothetical protein n=1 Tax=Kitasatospora sp. NA04385 TaxID=2742135 RepID=UPI00158FE28C|nr:hypothetical protein [Kitasatospora sp. NA04385]QKW22784.1 hypothetical protein HUT16_30135 [Kitasatospora sp. NA04385]